jgi:RNA polymerase-associated protein RTF1
MSDIDDELLALAGGASSDEEDADAPMDASRGNSGSPAKPSAKSSTKKTGSRKQNRKNDSEEEGEA